jgi:DNA topoisomerase IA
VVDRYLKRERFVSQGFWTIEMEIKHDNGRMQLHTVVAGKLSCARTIAYFC